MVNGRGNDVVYIILNSDEVKVSLENIKESIEDQGYNIVRNIW